MLTNSGFDFLLKSEQYSLFKCRLSNWESYSADGDSTPFMREFEAVKGRIKTINCTDYIDFTSYDYLSLASDIRVKKAGVNALTEYGTSASASRVAGGHSRLHRELDQRVASLLGTEKALTFVGGFLTNASVIGHIVGQDDLIIIDSLAHASILEGCRLSGAKTRRFKHNDANKFLNSVQ